MQDHTEHHAVLSSNPNEQHSHSYSVQLGNDQFQYRSVQVHDPVPSARQIIEAGAFRPLLDFQVFQLLSSGLLKQLGLDETVDLRVGGEKKFIVFQSDSSYRILIDDRETEWGQKTISGHALKILAGVDSATYGVWLEVRGGGEDQLVSNEDLIDLSRPGVERFFTGLRETTEGRTAIVLPQKCRSYMVEHGINYEQVDIAGQKAIILSNFALPKDKYSESHADILIMLPAGYPDSAPDMFYTLPWLKLKASGGFPRAADHPISFDGKEWQRWSRHNNEWRGGVDGIWTMMKRIETALEIAE